MSVMTGRMARIKFTKKDVNQAFEAVLKESSAPGGQRPNVIKSLLDRAKKIPGRLGGQSV